MPLAKLAVLVAFTASLSGCSMFARSVEQPTVEVTAVSLSSVGFAGATGAVDLELANPNPFGLPLSAIEWQLAVAGSPAVSGSIELSQEIPARGTAPVRATLSIGAVDAARVAAAIAGGRRDYRLTAKLRFTTRLRPIEVEVSHAGELAR